MNFYKGKSEIKDREEYVMITLHDYEYYDNFTVQVTPIDRYSIFYVTEVIDGKFRVYGEGKFYYLVCCEQKSDDTYYPQNGF